MSKNGVKISETVGKSRALESTPYVAWGHRKTDAPLGDCHKNAESEMRTARVRDQIDIRFLTRYLLGHENVCCLL